MIEILLAVAILIALGAGIYALKESQLRARLEAELEAERRQAAEKIALLQSSTQEAKDALSNQFKNLANEILEEKSRRFALQNQENLNVLLKPLSEKLSEFRQQVNDTYQNEARERFALKQEIERLAGLNLQMSNDTKALTNALKGESKTQGDWGELVLETILENSGLRKGEEYLVQDTQTMADGSRLQPDVVIRLPEAKHLVIDSKVSITAYTRYMQADDESQKNAELSAHVQSIRQHIQGLSAKNYQDLYALGSIDFVLMFIPVEPAFLAAMRHAPDIYQEALRKNIVLVCPSTLLATVRTVAHVWRQEHQNRNAQEIARQCANLYDKFVGFVDDLEKVGQRLEQAQVSYGDAVNKLKTGKGNLIRTAENVKKLGVKPNKSLPNQLLDTSDDA
ncbi:DNA recombination protein RmuC [Polynucleobacter sp. MWH-Loch1C5]|uniref:DNA recombination protein RmuC n=1 Tax=Polynucleobacter sp. MWH-Loch1C5 TaxID=2689108 RepID=UPI001C0E01D1|nr:DNA recombination protein RmuC [Polynucleobacter sp. MWH-Loch1C5]MBU3542334.1 DNA recombination protein RmuC [Polynucleobacter sp. MWH-Loch1C5]